MYVNSNTTQDEYNEHRVNISEYGILNDKKTRNPAGEMIFVLIWLRNFSIQLF
mgnify:CR=1 FL=1